MKKLRLCIIFILLCFSISVISAKDPYENVPGYKSTKVDRTGWPFHGAVTYNGKIYGVEIGGAARNFVTLVQFDTNPDSGELTYSKEYVITSGGLYADAEAVVWNNRIWIFWNNVTSSTPMWCREFYFDEKGEGKIGDTVDFTKCLSSLSWGTIPYGGNFAVTLYKDYVCLLYHIKPEGRVRIAYSKDLTLKTWVDFGNVCNGTNDNINFGGVLGGRPVYLDGLDDAWDATSWVGKRNGKDSEMLIVTRVKSKEHNFEVYSYEGDFETDNKKDWNWNVVCGGAKSKAFYVKAIQAAVESFTDKDTNPIQIVYASTDNTNTGEIFIKEFYPETLSFPEGKHNFTDIPYGFFGVAVGNIVKKDNSNTVTPNIDYQQKLYIIRGNGPGYHWHQSSATTMNSYVTNIFWNNYANEDNGYFSDPALRPLIKLIGIVEGPPPTLATEAYYASKDTYMETGRLEIANSKSEMTTVIRNGEVKVGISFGNDAGPTSSKDLLGSLGIGYEFNKQVKTVEIIEKSVGFTFKADTYKNTNATAFMMIPTIKKTEFDVYLYGDKNKSYPRGTDMSIMGQAITQVPIPLSGNPFNVSYPANLFYWSHRAILNGATNLPEEDKIQTAFGLNSNEAYWFSSGTNENSSKSTHKVLLDASIRIAFFKLENSATMEWTNSSTTTFKNDIKLRLFPIHGATTDMMKSYNLNLNILTNGNHEITKRYYDKMKGVKVNYAGSTFDLYTESDGTPFIFAWDVVSMSDKDNLKPSGVDDAEIGGCKAYAVSGGIKIECADMANVEVINTLGVRVANRKVSGDEIIPVNDGLYIVRLNNNGTVKTVKVLVGR